MEDQLIIAGLAIIITVNIIELRRVTGQTELLMKELEPFMSIDGVIIGFGFGLPVRLSGGSVGKLQYISKLPKRMFFKRIFNSGSSATSSKSTVLPFDQVKNSNDSFNHKTLGSGQNSIFQRANNQNKEQKSIKFDFKEEVAQLTTKLLQLNSAAEKEEKDYCVGSDLVGVINQCQIQEKFIRDQSIKVRIGEQHEVSCLSALRPNSLDELVVYWTSSCHIKMRDLLVAQQKMILVMEKWEDVKNFLTEAEMMLLSDFDQSAVSMFADKLLFNLTLSQKMFIINFLDNRTFVQRFITIIKEVFPELRDFEDLSMMVTLMNLFQFQQCVKKEISPKLKMNITEYKKQMEKNLREKKVKEEIRRLELLFAADDEKQKQGKSRQKIGRGSDEWEADYFSKIENEEEEEVKESVAHNDTHSKNAELYYFIEEHDSIEDLERSIKELQNLQLHSLTSEHLLARVRSCNDGKEAVSLQLDDEFFNRE